VADWEAFRKVIGEDDHLNLLKIREDRHRSVKLATVQQQREAEERAREDRTPLSPREWIDNPYFCGHLADDAYDLIKDHFCEVYEQRVFELILRGSIGWGKTYLTAAVEMYSIHLIGCYGTPQKAFRKMATTAQILYMSLNVTKEKAKAAYFRELKQMMMSAPYFMNQQDFPMEDPVRLVNEIRLPKNVFVRFAGASKTAAESENLIFVVLDEANLYDVVDKSKRSDPGQVRYDEAQTVYDSATTRMMTRYLVKDEGGIMPLPCKVVVLCRETVPNSFTEKRATEVEKKGLTIPDVDTGRCRAKVYAHSEWETKLDEYDMDDVFWVVLPTRTQSAQVIEDRQVAEEIAKNGRLMEASGADPQEIQRVVECPRAGGMWVDKATADTLMFIRQVIGLPTEGTNMLFDDKSVIVDCHRTANPPMVPREVCLHPYTEETTDFHDGVFLIKDRLARPVDPKEPEGEWRPIRKPDMPRYIGIDTSISGAASGFCVVGVDGFVERLRMGKIAAVDENKEAVRELVPRLWVDLALLIRPPPGGEVPYDALLDLVNVFRDMGFSVDRVGFDTFERVSLSQPLEKMGFDWEIVSTDTSVVPYEWTKRAYTERRISAYPYPPMEEQLAGLQRFNDGTVRNGQPVEKIIKGPYGKDASDALARAVFLAETYAQQSLETGQFASGRGDPEESKGEREYRKGELLKSGNLERLYEIMKKEEEERNG